MRTQLEQALELNYPPLALFFSHNLPEGAALPSPMCSMLLVAQAAKGETVALSRASCRCPGAANGFGLEDLSLDAFPGGDEGFYRFLSVGNEGWEPGRAVLQQLKAGGAPKILLEEFAKGEGFCKSPDLARAWTKGLPTVKAGGDYTVIKPLSALKAGETPRVVTLLANPDQISALVVLANFARPGVDNVRVPFSAGCASLGLLPFAEAESDSPRAVIGLTDISARFFLRKALGSDMLSFTAPLSLFTEMEANVPESFLSRFAWKTMTGKGEA